jgi:adenylylsulfate kinase
MNNKITNEHTVWHEPTIYRKDREAMNGHKSAILWFTGLSGSGKSTLAHAVEDSLHKNYVKTWDFQMQTEQKIFEESVK